MKTALVAHEAIHKLRPNDILIKLTDIKFHTNMKQTSSQGRNIEKSLEQKTEGRIVFNPEQMVIEKIPNGAEIMTLPLIGIDDPYFKKFVEKKNLEGKRVFIHRPKQIGLDMGNDMKQFVESKKGKRILRKINKDK